MTCPCVLLMLAAPEHTSHPCAGSCTAMSRISRTRSAAAGIEAPAATANLHSEPLGNAAAAAKSRHSDLRQQQPEAKPPQQLAVMPAEHSAAQHSMDTPQAECTAQQGSKDENMQSEAAKPPQGKVSLATGTSLPLLTDSRTARTRSLPPKPTTTRTRSLRPPASTKPPPHTAAPAEHAEHAGPAMPAAPSANHLSSTLAGIAQSLVSFSNSLHSAPPVPSTSAPEQIDMDFDFTNDSDDSDFQPELESAHAAEEDDEVIELSQEDPLDVVEHGDGSIAIRSPLQAAAVAAVEATAATAATAVAACGDDDDEEEFQQLQGKGKRKAAAAKDATAGMTQHSHACLSLFVGSGLRP